MSKYDKSDTKQQMKNTQAVEVSNLMSGPEPANSGADLINNPMSSCKDSSRESIVQFIDNVEKHWPEAYQNLAPQIIRIHRLHEYIQQGMIEIFTEYDLQQADFGVLAALRRSGEPYCLTPTELYQAMLFSSGGLTKVLSRVLCMGLIERLDNPNDKRSKMVKLTLKGKRLVEEIILQVHQLEQSKIQVLTASEQNQLDYLLDKLLKQWE